MNAGKVDQPLETRHPGMRDARERECVVPDEPEPRADRSVTRHLDLDAIDRSPRIDRPARDLRRAVTCDVVEGAERLQVRPVVDACRRGWLSTGWPGAVSAGPGRFAQVARTGGMSSFRFGIRLVRET